MQEQAREGKMPPFTEWFKTGNDFLALMLKMSPAMSGMTDDMGERTRSVELWEAAMKMWQSASSAMSEPETADAVLKGISTLPDVFMKITEATWDVCFEMQKKAIERAGKIGQQVEAYQFDNIDQEMFRTIRDIYESELKQFFYVPQLGLTRSYQERFNICFDKANLMHVVALEFLSLICLPFEQSFKVVQQQLDELARQGKLPKQTKEYYNMFIKALEGHYMALFKSAEYNKCLGTLFQHLSEYVIARNEVLQDMLQLLPVPTYKEMDELYKDLHILKKRVKYLESQLPPGS